MDVFDDSAEWMVNGDSMIGGTYRGKAEFAELLSRMAEKTARVEAIRAWPANNEVMAADISSPAAGARVWLAPPPPHSR
ncbi:hypothetical protein A4G26_10805 [Mycobacterium kansasii]|nr:hypothetical protein A4G26_10805 [Mycobacterium kansasii]